MTLTLELPEELETQLQEAAARNGQDPATFAVLAIAATVRGAVQNAVAPPNGNALTVDGDPSISWEEFEAALDELEEIGAAIPPVDESITYSREDIYFDHD